MSSLDKTKRVIAYMCVVAIVGIVLWMLLTPGGRAERAKSIETNNVVSEASRLGEEARRKAFCEYYIAHIPIEETPHGYKHCWEAKS